MLAGGPDRFRDRGNQRNGVGRFLDSDGSSHWDCERHAARVTKGEDLGLGPTNMLGWLPSLSHALGRPAVLAARRSWAQLRMIHLYYRQLLGSTF